MDIRRGSAALWCAASIALAHCTSTITGTRIDGSDAETDRADTETDRADTETDRSDAEVVDATAGDDAAPDATLADASADRALRDEEAADVAPRCDCDAGLTCCDGVCVNLASDARHCGGCAVTCVAPEHGAATCAAGACAVMCGEGYALRDGRCVRSGPPRPLWPPSASNVTSRRPRFRWEPAPTFEGARLEVCRDRACARVEQSLDLTGAETSLPTDLEPGVHFWRLFGRDGATVSSVASPVWEFFVGRRSAANIAAWGAVPDFNGDGLGDVAVGAYRVREFTGRAHVYLGRASGLPATPDVSLDPSVRASTPAFGTSVASVGDVNGDGFADLAVSAPGLSSYLGVVYIYFGSPSGPSTRADLILRDPVTMPGSRMGKVVAGLGDVNGDGYADLAASGETLSGSVYVFLGGPRGPAASPSMTLNALAYGGFGASIAGAGDVNCDGYGDMAIGEPRATRFGTATATGVAYLFFGGPSGFERVPGVTLLGADEATSAFGESVAGVGDLDGDGCTELAVGNERNGILRGLAHVFHFGPGVTAVRREVRLEPPARASAFGHAFDAGDLDGDGYDDLVVTAHGTSLGASGTVGRAYVYPGGTSGVPEVPSFVLAPPTGTSGSFGAALSVAGDLDGDGFRDVVVTDPFVNGYAGRAFVFRGADGGPAISAAPELPPPDGAAGQFGWSIAR